MAEVTMTAECKVIKSEADCQMWQRLWDRPTAMLNYIKDDSVHCPQDTGSLHGSSKTTYTVLKTLAVCTALAI